MNLDALKASLPAHLNARFDPALVELVPHQHPLGEEDVGAALIAMRERVPRQLKDGRWERLYFWMDGTSQLVWLASAADYDRWEKPWIASPEYKPYGSSQKPPIVLDRSVYPRGLTPIVEPAQ